MQFSSQTYHPVRVRLNGDAAPARGKFALLFIPRITRCAKDTVGMVYVPRRAHRLDFFNNSSITTLGPA